MMVYTDTARVLTQKTFRDAGEAATFASRIAKDVVSIRRSYGRIIVKYYAKATRKVWSVDRSETSKKRATYKLSPENWPQQYR